MNHPFPDLVPKGDGLTEEDWRLFLRNLIGDKGDLYMFSKLMETLKSGGGTGKTAIYDCFTATSEKHAVMGQEVKLSKMFLTKLKGHVALKPKFAAQNTSEMFVGGINSKLWNP